MIASISSSRLADGQNDPAIARIFATGNQKIPFRIVPVEEGDMRGHMCVDFGQIGLVDEFDHEHAQKLARSARAPKCILGPTSTTTRNSVPGCRTREGGPRKSGTHIRAEVLGCQFPLGLIGRQREMPTQLSGQLAQD